MKLIGKKVEVFRCVVDPNIPGIGPKNAINVKDVGGEAIMGDVGVFYTSKIKQRDGSFKTYEHVVPYPCISAVRLDIDSK